MLPSYIAASPPPVLQHPQKSILLLTIPPISTNLPFSLSLLQTQKERLLLFCLYIVMSQGYAIELYLDPSLENQVLKAWNILAQRQISTQLIEIESRPHITLFSTPSFIDPSKIEPLIKSFAAKQDPIKLNFSSIGSFPDEGNTLFLSPTPALSSLQFQTQLYDLLKKEGFEIGDEFWVDSWVPICSVAQDVPKSRMTEAKKFRVDLWVPICSVAQDEFQVDLWVPIRGMDIGF